MHEMENYPIYFFVQGIERESAINTTNVSSSNYPMLASTTRVDEV